MKTPTVNKLPKKLSWIKKSDEYNIISKYYKKKFTKSYGVPYINHIHEGIVLLDNINLSRESKLAFCLHPIVQDDLWDDVIYVCRGIVEDAIDVEVMDLAMEFADTANQYLSKNNISKAGIKLSKNKLVNDMLLADKVQNYKDFLKYHKDKHPRSKQLDTYFRNWFTALGTDFERFEILAKFIK